MKLKKIVRFLVITILLLFISLAAIPLIFKDKIKDMVVTTINNNVNTKVAVTDADLSLFTSFPQAALSLKDVSVINKAPFENDTLVFAKTLEIDLPIMDLFKSSDEAIHIMGISINQALINITSNNDGIVNYDITKNSSAEEDTNDGFNFDLKKYKISNSTINYIDEQSKMQFNLVDFNHTGSGNLSANQSKLDTKTDGLVSFEYDGTKYLDNSTITLDALIGIDLKTNTYSFLRNNAVVNGLPLVFDGSVILFENEQQIDISFETPSSSFKNFLAVMPKEYSKNMDAVKTEGDFTVKGLVKGTSNDFRIPTIDINIASNNASFKYPNLPKGVQDITIKAAIKNETGFTKDTYINVDAFNFRIDEDYFTSNANVKNLTSNPLVNAALKGTINLENLSRAYPIKVEQKLSGTLKMDVTSAFDMDAVEKSNYERIKNKGTIDLSNFIYLSDDFKNPLNLSQASIVFSPEKIELKNFKATTGKTDISASGSLKDVIGFIVSDKSLKGNFKVTSNTFNVNDFMGETSLSNENQTKLESPIKIPAFLDCTITAEAKTVNYDNLELKNLNGKLSIKDQKVIFEDINSSIFNGIIALNGSVSTKENTPTFTMDVSLKTVDISKAFTEMNLLKSLAPIAGVLEGKLNTGIKLSGSLDSSFSPDLKTISGNAVAEILSQKISNTITPVLKSLTSQLSFIDLNKIELKDLKAALTFENGRVNVKPFNIKYKDIDVAITGSHGFDKSMDYKTTFNVPGKYLGNEVTGLLSKMSSQDASKIIVPITASISGNFTNPLVTTDYKTTTKNLVGQLIDFNKAKGKGNDILNNILTGNSIKKDSVPSGTKPITVPISGTSTIPKPDEIVRDKLNGFLNKKKKKKDSLGN